MDRVETQKKLRRRKFIRNIIIGLVSLGIISFILDIAPGYMRDRFQDQIGLIVNGRNLTEELSHEIYIDDRGVIFFSIKDVQEFFDSTIYHDTKNNQIITTSDTKVATLSFERAEIKINNVSMPVLARVIELDGVIYIPVSEMEIVYNIEIDFFEEHRVVSVQELSNELIIANVNDDITLRFRPRRLSRSVADLTQGQRVLYFGREIGNWKQVQTVNGQTGFIQVSAMSNERVIRRDAIPREEAQIITLNADGTSIIYRNRRELQIMVQDMFKLTDDNRYISRESDNRFDVYNLWVTVSNLGLEDQTDAWLMDYDTRSNIINAIVSALPENDIRGVIVDFEGIQNIQNLERFLIELTPRLREIGIYVGVQLNEGTSEANVNYIVDVIVN
ncbi:MAG: hypothetical protein FWC79_07740 [Oscillospiraceae bacterium]|nr:hypothetical protein [Oscillospiraceae bacterium]